MYLSIAGKKQSLSGQSRHRTWEHSKSGSYIEPKAGVAWLLSYLNVLE